MIICITGNFDVYDAHGYKTGRKEFVVSHGVDYETDKVVILPSEHPTRLGAQWDSDLQEWVIYDQPKR